MKTLTAKQVAATTSPAQRPAYLVELNFSTVIRLCTRGQVDWNGFMWYQGGCQVGQFAIGQAGVQTVAISLANNSFAYSKIVLGETASGKRVRIWKLFGEPPYSVSDASLVFNGLIDDVPELGDVVTLNCATANARTLLVPNITIGLPYFTNMPRAGQVIYWGDESYELQPR